MIFKNKLIHCWNWFLPLDFNKTSHRIIVLLFSSLCRHVALINWILHSKEYNSGSERMDLSTLSWIRLFLEKLFLNLCVRKFLGCEVEVKILLFYDSCFLIFLLIEANQFFNFVKIFWRKYSIFLNTACIIACKLLNILLFFSNQFLQIVIKN